MKFSFKLLDLTCGRYVCFAITANIPLSEEEVLKGICQNRPHGVKLAWGGMLPSNWKADGKNFEQRGDRQLPCAFSRTCVLQAQWHCQSLQQQLQYTHRNIHTQPKVCWQQNRSNVSCKRLWGNWYTNKHNYLNDVLQDFLSDNSFVTSSFMIQVYHHLKRPLSKWYIV